MPDGHIAQEFQEYLRLVVIPKCQYLALYFENPKTRNCYQRLKADLDWSDDDGSCFLLALDKDKRHSMNDMQHYRLSKSGTGHGELRDRRELDKFTEGWISLHEKQIVPAAPKQCDTVQAPVEMAMSQIKRKARKLLPSVGQKSGRMIVDAIMEAGSCVTTENVDAYWRHANKANRVWSALECEVVECMLKRNNYTVPYTFTGTHGDWVPKELRG